MVHLTCVILLQTAEVDGGGVDRGLEEETRSDKHVWKKSSIKSKRGNHQLNSDSHFFLMLPIFVRIIHGISSIGAPWPLPWPTPCATPYPAPCPGHYTSPTLCPAPYPLNTTVQYLLHTPLHTTVQYLLHTPLHTTVQYLLHTPLHTPFIALFLIWHICVRVD